MAVPQSKSWHEGQRYKFPPERIRAEVILGT